MLKLPNSLVGATVTAAGFDTPPANLEKATNGNVSDPCGEGSTVKEAAGSCGKLIVDRGAGNTFPILIYPILGLHTSTGSMKAFLEVGDSAGSYLTNGNMGLCPSITAESETFAPIQPPVVKNRYFQILLYSNAAQTAYVKPYEILGLKI